MSDPRIWFDAYLEEATPAAFDVAADIAIEHGWIEELLTRWTTGHFRKDPAPPLVVLEQRGNFWRGRVFRPEKKGGKRGTVFCHVIAGTKQEALAALLDEWRDLVVNIRIDLGGEFEHIAPTDGLLSPLQWWRATAEGKDDVDGLFFDEDSGDA